jgi:hypothetical protein
LIERIHFQAFVLKEKLQEKLKKSREETEKTKKDIEQLQSKVDLSSFLFNKNFIFLFRLVKVYY